jgi:chromosome segregation ATPase
MLDQAIELFQQSAAGLMKEDPQLAQYVQSVQQLQEQTHKLSGDLIEVQQQQHKRLSALKKDVDDRVQARQAELWANDKSLGELRAQLDLAQRKYNAAVDLNYPTDSPELKRALADIRDLTGRIDARKMALGNDPIVTSVADGLAEMINITKERLEADRARIEKDIKDQERMFAQSNMVERLPETQRAQAAALKAKQEAINDLRKQYAAALDKRTAESNAALRDIEGQVSSVTAKIDERKRLLAADNAKNLTQQQEADRKANLAKAQAALKQADERAATARQAYAQASRALTSAAARTTERTEKQQQLEAIDQSLASTLDQAKQDERALESLNDQLKTLVTIVQPSEANIRVDEGRDDRWLYSAGAVVGLAVLFGILAVVSVAGGDGTARRGSTGEEDDAEAGPLAIHEIGSHQSIAG